MVSWSSFVLNEYVAPEIVSFTEVDIPDLTAEFPEAPHWVANHFLNSVLRGTYKGGTRQLVLGFVRRAFHAFEEFHSARQDTYNYLNGNDPHNPRITKFYKTVAKWETFALQISMALDLFKEINKGEGAFIKNDGSVEWRLYTIANQIKHLDSCVRSGQCKSTDTVPLWLTNHGLASFGVAVTYAEAAEVLRNVSSLAQELYDPVSLRERLEREDSESDATPA